MNLPRIRLIVEQRSEDTEVSIAALDDDYRSVRLLHREPRVFRLELEDATRPLGWDPMGDELSWAGRAFAQLLRRLYDGRRWRLNLYVSMHLMVHEAVESLVGGHDSQPTWEWLVRQMEEQGLVPAFWVGEPWRLGTAEDDPQDHRWYHWWCPKSALLRVLTTGWDWNCKGYLAPGADRERLRECFSLADPAERLDRLLDTCRFVVEGTDHGSAMILVSRALCLEDVRGAAEDPSVGQALPGLMSAVSSGVPVGPPTTAEET